MGNKVIILLKAYINMHKDRIKIKGEFSIRKTKMKMRTN
jgi:hypothetical protein